MLTISLRKLSRGPVEEAGRVSMNEEPWTGVELDFRENPSFDLTARETGDGVVHVTGTLHAVLELSCRRCLTDVPDEVDLSVDWLYDPGLEGQAEDEGVFPLDRDTGSLDLTPQIREEILLAAPPFPLCTEECEGLCPECGTNLNEGSCDCTREEIDPRWEKLRQLTDAEG